MAGAGASAASNESVADLLRSIFLLPDRDADFGRFAKSVEFATILRLLQTFGVRRRPWLSHMGPASRGILDRRARTQCIVEYGNGLSAQPRGRRRY